MTSPKLQTTFQDQRMGFENRDYYRSDDDGYDGGNYRREHRSGDHDLTSTMVGKLIVMNIVFFVVQVLWSHDGESYLEDWLAMAPDAVNHGQIWRLVTYALLHSTHSLWHIIGNLLVLWFLGRDLESRLGSKEFLCLYFTGAFVGGLTQYLFQRAYNLPFPAIGASGATFALFTLYVMYWPTRTFLIFFVLPVEARWLFIFDFAFEIFPVLQTAGGRPVFDGVAHAAHLGGAFLGYFYFRLNWYLLDAWRPMLKWGNPKAWLRYFRRPRLRVVRDPAEPQRGPSDADRVDLLLQKILEKGEASLTAEERKFLTEASRRARERRDGG